MKRTYLSLIIVLILLCSGCGNKDPFNNYDIKFSELSSSEISAIKEIESELTCTADATVYGDASLVHFSNNVKRGNKAEIVLCGKPNTEYTIRVTYSSGISKAKALKPQLSDNEGYVAWIWTVGAKTKIGNYPVEILENGATVLRTQLIVS